MAKMKMTSKGFEKKRFAVSFKSGGKQFSATGFVKPALFPLLKKVKRTKQEKRLERDLTREIKKL